MRSYRNYKVRVPGAAKDLLVIALLFISLCFIDISTAAFVGVMTTSLLIIRRTLLNVNPSLMTEIPAGKYEKELTLSKGIEVFDLCHVHAMEYLYKYIEITVGLLAPPSVLIIRFRGITALHQYDPGILRIAIKRLEKNKIIAILADVTPAVRQQFITWGIESITGKENIFREIGEAIPRAENLVKRSRSKQDQNHRGLVKK